jgi:hypothetical protein
MEMVYFLTKDYINDRNELNPKKEN